MLWTDADCDAFMKEYFPSYLELYVFWYYSSTHAPW